MIRTPQKPAKIKKKSITKKTLSKQSITSKKHSVKIAIVAVLLFAATGTYMLSQSFAAATNVAPTGTYTDWNWPGQNYNSFDWQVTPGIDQTGPDAYFYSHQVGFVGGDGGYAGMQGDSNGKRAIFSIWQAMTATGPEIAQPFSGEGTGYQTMIKYNWVTGRAYQYHIQKVSVDADGTWWEASVRDSVTGVTSTIGQIKVPLAWGGLSNFSIVWTERYTGPMNVCSDIHHSAVTFSNFTANNGTVLPVSHNNHLSDPVNCPGSQISNVPGGVRQEMGVGNDLPAIIKGSPGKSLSDLTPSYVSNGYGPLMNDLSNGGKTMSLKYQRYARGLGSHANAEIKYALGGKYSYFIATVGVDDEVDSNGSVDYQIWADGIKLFDSGTVTGASPAQTINVNVTGKQELQLIATDAGDNNWFDHADWADARLLSLPPQVTIASPSNGARVNLYTTISASASGSKSVTKMEAYVDGQLKSSSNTDTINYNWFTQSISRGTHTVLVKAYDPDGNVGQSSVAVTKK